MSDYTNVLLGYYNIAKMHIQYKSKEKIRRFGCMVNYEFIGARIREARLRKKLSQEQLAAMVDVGTSHISHIETGATIPSTKLLEQLMNILDCDPNEVLCMETRSTRPILNSWLSELVADCNEDEIKIITDTVMALKTSLRRNRIEDK